MGVWERIEKYTMPEPNSGCWLWNGACGNDGYPRITIGSLKDNSKRSARVSRLVCEKIHGLPDNMQALHRCDNVNCVNPDHIYPGTSSQNTKDCIDRNRRTQIKRGEKNNMAVLVPEDVLHIRSSEKSGVELAAKYGVSQALISLIRSRKLWRHI